MYTVEQHATPVGYAFVLKSDEYPDFVEWMAELTPELVARALASVAYQVQERERRCAA